MAKKYNCVKNGVQYYRITKTIGHRADGKPVKKEFYGDGEKDALKQAEEYMQKKQKGLNVEVENLTIEQAMYSWLFDVLLHSKNKKSATFDKHECNYRNYIKNRKIGTLRVQNVTSLPFQKYYTELFEKGTSIITKNNKVKHITVSENKISDLNKTLRAFFNYCIKQKYTLNNPCSLENIELPGNSDGNEDDGDEGNIIQAFSEKEILTIKNNLKYVNGANNTFNVAIMLDLITGLRIGELLGLKKKFVTQYVVKVRNTLKRAKIFDSETSWYRETKLIKPKSKTSIRDVPFPVPFWKVLEEYIREQEIKWKDLGLNFNDESLLFTTETCKPYDVKNFSRAWERFLNKIKIPKRKLHSIRDTYATTLIRRGANIHDVKALLGHSSIKITEKYYIFIFPDDKSKTVSLLDNLVV